MPKAHASARKCDRRNLFAGTPCIRGAPRSAHLEIRLQPLHCPVLAGNNMPPHTLRRSLSIPGTKLLHQILMRPSRTLPLGVPPHAHPG